MNSPADAQAALRRELESIPAAERLDYLADLPRERLAAFRRALTRDELAKLNAHLDRQVARRHAPTLENWLAAARAGNAETPEAMVEVLREILDRLAPPDRTWIDRIEKTSGAVGYSKRQRAVIAGIYAKYFRPGDDQAAPRPRRR
jgi:predicted transcriptional regulator